MQFMRFQLFKKKGAPFHEELYLPGIFYAFMNKLAIWLWMDILFLNIMKKICHQDTMLMIENYVNLKMKT